MNSVMVDIETLGTESFSSILSIGAVEFDINTGETGREFYKNISLKSCMDLGLKVDANTVMWWLQQSDQARATLGKNTVPIQEALSDFAHWFNRDYTAWGNSARFDLGLLMNAYSKAKLHVPWDFRKERCVRTLVSFKPELKENYKRSGVDHNALSDCYNQIGYCSEIWKTLNQS